MIRILILLIALISFSFGQYSETFSDFTGTVFDSTKAKWVFGSGYTGGVDNIGNDQSGNGNNLTASVGFDYASQLTGTSPIYEGDNALVFDGLDDHWYISSFTDFNLNQGTVCVWANIPTLTPASHRTVIEFRVNASNNAAFYFNSTANEWRLKYKSGGITKENVITFSINTWTHFAITWDEVSDEVKTYIDGSQIGSTLTGLGNWAGANPYFAIGAQASTPSSLWLECTIGGADYHTRALAADEIKEQCELAYGWDSENANVLRNNVTDWFQGFYANTISINTGVTGKYKFKAKGENGGETLYVCSGSNSKNYTLTNAWQNYNITLDGTLYFASTDTVYEDDIKKSGNRGYSRYLQYGQYWGY